MIPAMTSLRSAGRVERKVVEWSAMVNGSGVIEAGLAVGVADSTLKYYILL
jgi:hypothetical protein